MGGARLFDGITHTTAAGRRFVLISEWLRGIMSVFFLFFFFPNEPRRREYERTQFERFTGRKERYDEV